MQPVMPSYTVCNIIVTFITHAPRARPVCYSRSLNSHRDYAVGLRKGKTMTTRAPEGPPQTEAKEAESGAKEAESGASDAEAQEPEPPDVRARLQATSEVKTTRQ